MTLTEIYEFNAKYVRDSGFKVKLDEKYGWVAIEDSNSRGFFLQGDDAVDYITGFRYVWEKAGDLSLDDAIYGHAKQYIDCL